MVAYLRKHIPIHGLQAVKDDLVNRQGYPRLEVEAACVEALRPQPTFLRRKPALIVEVTACLLTAGILMSIRRGHRPVDAAPRAELPAFPLVAPASMAVPAAPAASAADQLCQRGLAQLRLWRGQKAPVEQGALAGAAGAQFMKGRQDLADCAALDAKLGRETARALAVDGADWVRREQGAGHRPIDTSFITLALDLAGNDPQVLTESAAAFLRLGRHADALAALTAAEKLDPSRPEIKQLRAQIGASLPP